MHGASSTAHAQEGTSLNDYVRVLRRRKWILLVSIVVIPLTAALISARETPLYKSTTTVFLSTKDYSTAITNIEPQTVFVTPERLAETQSALALSQTVAEKTVEAAGADLSPGAFLASAEAEPSLNSDLLYLSVTTADPELSTRLANAFAEEYIAYKETTDTAPIKDNIENLDDQLRALEAAGEEDSSRYEVLQQEQERLEVLSALQVSESFVLSEAGGAFQVGPKPVRDGLIGLMLGIVLGIGLAFLREALDTRVRSGEEVADKLGLPLLARLPSPPRRLAAQDRLVMLDDPTSTEAEAFRMLRTNLEFANLERGARVLLVTSAVQGEGKSTTAANLAVALARAGRHVTLVDLDLRRPYLDRFFELRGRPGLTQVALGHASLDEALVSIAFTSSRSQGRNVGNGHSTLHGVIEVLPSGPIPPDAGEFVGTNAVAGIIDELRERSDIVIVDVPPLLNVGDTMTLSSRADGILFVLRLKALRRPILRELERLLRVSPAQTLGFVVTGAEADAAYEAYSYGYEEPRQRTREREGVR